MNDSGPTLYGKVAERLKHVGDCLGSSTQVEIECVKYTVTYDDLERFVRTYTKLIAMGYVPLEYPITARIGYIEVSHSDDAFGDQLYHITVTMLNK